MPTNEDDIAESMNDYFAAVFTAENFVKVSVYPKFDHFSKKLIFTFSDRSYCNLSFKKNPKKKD